jgi:hypothetical protein
VIVSAEDASAVAGCRTVEGTIEVRGAGELDLEALKGIERVTGDVTIGPTFGVTVISLDGIRTVGGTLRIVSNGVATGVYLPALEQAGGIEIASNVAAGGVAMPALASVEHDLLVEQNPVLENLTMGSLGRVGGTLRIKDNRALAIVEIGAVEAGVVDVAGDALPDDFASKLARPHATLGP